MVQSTISTIALDCFGYKGCICTVKMLSFFFIQHWNRHDHKEEYSEAVQDLDCLEAEIYSEVRKVIFQKGCLKILPQKNQPNEVRQVNTVHEWVRNSSSLGAS